MIRFCIHSFDLSALVLFASFHFLLVVIFLAIAFSAIVWRLAFGFFCFLHIFILIVFTLNLVSLFNTCNFEWVSSFLQFASALRVFSPSPLASWQHTLLSYNCVFVVIVFVWLISISFAIGTLRTLFLSLAEVNFFSWCGLCDSPPYKPRVSNVVVVVVVIVVVVA